MKLLLFVTLGCFAVLSWASNLPNYCQAPLAPASVDTAGKTLRMVQVITRHGDRTPVSDMSEIYPPAFWNCNLTFLTVPDSSYESELHVPRLCRKNYLKQREVLPGNCEYGQLTYKGFIQHQELGNSLRELYVHKYKLLPVQLDTSKIWIRHTDIPRTLQSAQGNLLGLYPTSEISSLSSSQVLDFYTMDMDRENAVANSQICPRISEAEKAVKESQAWKDYEKQMAPLAQKMSKQFNVPQDKLPEWYSFMDDLYGRQCHGLAWPPGISQDDMNQIVWAENTSSRLLWTNDSVAIYGLGLFLQELQTQIDNFVLNQEGPVYLMYSAHDTTVGPLSALLGVWDGQTPPYAAHAEFELWSEGKDWFVQLKYNGFVTTIPGCKEMCPYDTWASYVNSLLPHDLEEECMKQNMDIRHSPLRLR